MINGANKTALIKFRAYQRGVFWNRTSRVVVLHWSRQIGKSFTLAAWAVDRLLTRPGRLVTVLSNSRDNGMEFIRKAAEVCEQMGEVMRKQGAVTSKIMDFTSEEIARRTEEANRLGDTDFIGRPDLEYECMRMEIRITVGGKEGRIKVLAANPRTARGFSGDLILDEFAFHQDSWAIWEAAEPILSSNQDFLCRIASTGNGKHNAFFKFCTNGEFEVSRVTRTDAYKLGCKIYDFKTGKEITPEEARARSADKAAYDQNYECAFRNEASALLTLELITRAERDGEGIICDQDWSQESLDRLKSCQFPLYSGYDVGRNRDFSVLSVFEKIGQQFIMRGMLRMEDMRLPEQQWRLGQIMKFPRLRRVCIDMTGLGLGLFEYSRKDFGGRIVGVDFRKTVPTTENVQSSGTKTNTVRVTEAMATELLHLYEQGHIWHPCEDQLRADLVKPEKLITPGGRVSIAATRDEAGHADHFWSFALAVEAAQGSGPFQYEPVKAAREGVGLRMERRRLVI